VGAYLLLPGDAYDGHSPLDYGCGAWRVLPALAGTHLRSVVLLVYQQVEGSVLQPLVYSRALQLSGLVIFVAVLVGGMLLGITGALLAVPVAEIIRIVVTDLVAYRRTRRGVGKPAVSSPSDNAVHKG
jgi:predicted PurR-regulated permease PerM